MATRRTMLWISRRQPGLSPAAGVAAYAVDESVLAILREEAEREAHARKADTAKPLETQTDLGLDAAIPPLRKGQVEVQTDPVSGDETPDDRHAIRRTRLPDVEEINSTLRPSELAETEADAAAMTPVAEGRSSFRSGFLLVMTLAILASAIYGSADAISAAVPALEGPLEGFCRRHRQFAPATGRPDAKRDGGDRRQLTGPFQLAHDRAGLYPLRPSKSP